MKKYVLAIDQGTTSTRAMLINERGEGIYKAQREVECLFPKPGWVETDANKIWVSVIDCINELMVIADCSMDDIAAIGITNQRESTIVWDKKTGKAVYNAVIWQSKQTQQLCDEREKYTSFIQEKTGLRMNPYFSASKIRFILDNIPDGQERAERGELLFGTIDTWLIYKMTNGKSHYTDVTNASRTMLFNIFTMSWDEELLKIWNIPSCMLPEVKSNADDFGKASFFQGSVPIAGVIGDQQAALFGQCCYNTGDCKNTYGTGCFTLMNIGDKPILSKKGLLTTVAWKIDGKTTYALEGSVFMGGAIIQWLRDQMALIKTAAQSEEYANRAKDTAGVYVVPAFVGLGTPYWDDEARGAVFGLTRGADRHNFVRATLFSIAYQTMDVIETMKDDASLNLTTLKVDGGASVNSLLMQFQSDILQCEIAVPKQVETTALGAGYMAGLQVGFYRSLDHIKENQSIQKTYNPTITKKEACDLYSGWQRAVYATRCYKPND